MSTVTVAATQMACSWDRDANIARAEKLIREAARRGANVVLIQELFETPYFCKDHSARHFELAQAARGSSGGRAFPRRGARARAWCCRSACSSAPTMHFTIPWSIVDADGAVLGSYRKSHIPEGPGYHEKFYFSPGDTGFKVFDTRYAKLGVAICWDQWFPEAARSHGADGRRDTALSHGHRLGTAGCRASIRAATGSAPCRVTRRPISCRWWLRIASAPRRAKSTP